MEAGALGKPVVASDIEGVNEIIRNEENGLLVPQNDPKRLAEAVMKLKTNPQFSFKLGRSLQNKIEEEYSLSRMVKKIEEIYSKDSIK